MIDDGASQAWLQLVISVIFFLHNCQKPYSPLCLISMVQVNTKYVTLSCKVHYCCYLSNLISPHLLVQEMRESLLFIRVVLTSENLCFETTSLRSICGLYFAIIKSLWTIHLWPSVQLPWWGLYFDGFATNIPFMKSHLCYMVPKDCGHTDMVLYKDWSVCCLQTSIFSMQLFYMA